MSNDQTQDTSEETAMVLSEEEVSNCDVNRG